MASQIKKKYIQNDAIDGDKILLESNQTLRKKDGMGGEIDVLADIASDIAQNANDISSETSRAIGEETAIRSEFATADAALQTEIDAAEVRLDSVETTLPLKADLVGGLVPASQLPSFVDDVEEYADLASFPVTGEMSKIYVALDTNKAYRWSGSMYIQITSGAVDTVNGQNGVVVLDAADILMVSEATTIEDKLISLQNEIDAEEVARANADSDLQNNIDAEKARAESSEAMLEAKLIVAETRIESLESEVQALQGIQWYTEKFVVDATMIANGFVNLARTPISGSIIGNVDRLSIFEGASEDFSNNGTTITFLNSLVNPGNQALQAGDELRFKYQA